jgi:predicted enzyme related to lactoylglutathione lyase
MILPERSVAALRERGLGFHRQIVRIVRAHSHGQSACVTRLANLAFDAIDTNRLARFWATTLGWEIGEDNGRDIRVLPTDGTRFVLAFRPVSEPKSTKNVIHLDLVSESVEHQRAVADGLIELGAQPVDIGQGPDTDHVVLADPEGNEFCIVRRGAFLADTGFLGAIVFEPADPATGHFWGEAIGWPVVYEQDGDVAVRAPDRTGPFITFGPPGRSRSAGSRLHLDLAPDTDEDDATAVDRLIALGAGTRRSRAATVPWVVLADPDGNEFRVLRTER